MLQFFQAPQMPSKRQIAKAALMPQFNLSFQGLAWSLGVAVRAIALLLLSAKLIDARHPALDLNHVGRATLLSLLRDARRNVRFDWQHLPQAVIFISVLGLIGCTLLMVATAIVKLAFGVAFASGMPGANLADNMLQQLFDVNGTGVTSPIAATMGKLFSIYSMAMLALAGVVLAYLVMNTIAETANSGVAFGRGFNHVWAPIRIILAFALLVPVTQAGLNAGQVLMIKIAEKGSDLATEAFRSMVGLDANGAATPRFAQWAQAGGNVGSMDVAAGNESFKSMVEMELCRAAHDLQNEQTGSNLRMTTKRDVSQNPALENVSGGSNLGTQNNQMQTIMVSYVLDQKRCGPITLHSLPAGQQPSSTGEQISSMDYRLWEDMRPQIASFADTVIDEEFNQNTGFVAANANISEMRARHIGDFERLRERFMAERRQIRDRAMEMHKAFLQTDLQNDINEQGWVAAATWMNTFARLNGQAIAAVGSAPLVAMHEARKPIATQSLTEMNLATAMQALFNESSKNTVMPTNIINAYAGNMSSVTLGTEHSNVVNNALFLTVFNAAFGEVSTNPLAQVQAFGRWVFDEGIKLVVLGYTGKAIGSVLGAVAMSFGFSGIDQIAGTIGGLLITLGVFMAGLGFLAGFLLPMVPMIRFVIGILGWLLLVFEAILAVPLIAIAHLRTDGEGIVGPMAQQAYLLGLSLFLRPILMIFGLFVGMVIANALITLVNAIFVPTVLGTGGAGGSSLAGVMALLGGMGSVMGSAIGSTIAFMTVYIFLVVTIVNASFKAIDLIPNAVMRWIGNNLTSSINDTHEVTGEARQQFSALMGLSNAGTPSGMALTPKKPNGPNGGGNAGGGNMGGGNTGGIRAGG